MDIETKRTMRPMPPMIRLILVKENTEKQGDYESLIPPREGSWTPTSKLFLQLWK
jgi:hypothetical protein